MDKAEVRTRIEIDQENMEYINFAYNEEITYCKKAALDRVLNEREEKELVDLAPPRVLLIRKEKIEKTVNIDEIIFYLKYILFYLFYSKCIRHIMKSQEVLLMIFKPTSLLLKQ